MEFKTLGNTGLLVSRICLGAMTFAADTDQRESKDAGIWKSVGQLGQGEVDALVKASVEAEVNFIDTADVYSEGRSEVAVGQALRNLGIARKDMVIATKVYGRTGPGRNDVGASRGHIMDAVDASLRRLGTDYIDLYQIHGNDAVTPLEETLRAMDTLVSSGKVRYVGVSNWAAWKMAKALAISEYKGLTKIDMLQAFYSIAARDLEREIVPFLEAEKMGLMVWSPLAGGLISGKYTRENQQVGDSRRSTFDFPIVNKERAWNIVDVLAPIAKAHNVSPATVALAYVLAKPWVTSVIIGAKRIDQLNDNLAAIKLKLTDDDLKKLDEVSALPPEYPGWMFAFQSSNRLANVQRPISEK